MCTSRSFIQCPNCNVPIQIVASEPRVAVRAASVAKRHLRPLTDRDRKVILSHNAKGWLKLTKHQLAGKLGLTINQVAAEVAWTHKNLGGRRYEKRYIG